MLVLIKLCRLCASDADVSLTLNNLHSDNITYFDKLNEIAPDLLKPIKELPNGICSTCVVQLNECYKFIKNCYQSQEILKQYSKQDAIISNVENEINPKNEIKSFEFIKVEPLENEEFIDESSEYKAERNQGQINYCSEINLNNSIKESINIEPVCNLQTGINIKEEKNLEDTEQRTNENIVESVNNCQFCEESFSKKVELQLHVSRNHRNDKRYKCEVCDKPFKFKANLKDHFRIHSDERPFVCEICERGFKQKLDLRRHARTHTNEKPFVCEICAKAFNQEKNLKRHIRTHSKQKPFVCEICYKAYTDRSSLKRHTRITHTTD